MGEERWLALRLRLRAIVGRCNAIAKSKIFYETAEEPSRCDKSMMLSVL